MIYRLYSLCFVLILSSHLLGQDFYDIFTIQTIEITFEETNWDETLDTYYANDIGEKLVGSVIINDIEYDSIGVKYKGNSTYSASNAKNPLHIYLDYIYKDQNHDGYESIKLSNGKNDPSFVREVLSYEIARKYTAAPLSNYAKVYINNEYYGMFSSSEAINGDFVDRRLNADDDNTRIKCNPEDTNDGNGPSLEYLGTDSADYYSYYEVKSDYGWQDLIDLTYGLAYEPTNIESILDIDRAIWMCAFNNVLVNLDSYTGPFRQNYYLVKDDNGIFMPVIWDLNESLGAFESIDMGGGGGPGGGGPGGESSSSDLAELDPFLREDDTTYPLIKLILDNDRYTKMYIAHCKTILEDNFVSGWYKSKADSLQALITTDLTSDNNAFYSTSQFTGNISGTQDNTIGITELMADRITFLQNETVFQYTQPSITNITSPEDPTPFSTVTVTAEISDASYVHLGYRYSKDDIFTKIEMYDDGAHNDGVANDNIYGVSFVVDEKNTHYYIYADNDDAGIFSPQEAEHEYYKIAATALEQEVTDVAINELMASNSTTQTDEMGEYDDWVELFNNTESAISMLGYYLSDDDDDLTQWPFPDTTIAANEYLIVWTDKDEEQDGLHANFKLSASGEDLYLVNSEFVIVNSSSFEEQSEDMAYARVPNGYGDFIIQEPTFSAINSESVFLKNNGITVNEGDTIQISTEDVSASSPYSSNINIIFTITTASVNGIFENATNTGGAITSFTQQNLLDGEIRYIHNGTNTVSDSITITVADENSEILDQLIKINITAIDDDPPTIVNNIGLSLNQGTSAIITSTKLLSTDSETEDSELLYTIESACVNGQLVLTTNTDLGISSFTQQNLIDGNVVYRHDSIDTTTDGFNFSVSDGINTLAIQNFSITINTIVDGAPEISINTGLSLIEGDTATLLSTMLSATDPDVEDNTLLFTITETTINGQLIHVDNPSDSIVSFYQQDLIDGKIKYIHNGSNTIFDSFYFTVSDASHELNNQCFTFTITPIDDDAPIIVINEPLVLNEGASATILLTTLSASDTEKADTTLLYNITSLPVNGTLVNAQTSDSSISSFLQQNLIDQDIMYVHNGSNTIEDNFIFEVSDGTNVLAEQQFNISITPVDDDAPSIINNMGLTLPQGSTATISTNELSASDTETDNLLLTYSISSLPTHGRLVHNDDINTAISAFTQQNLLNNAIQYIHDGSNNYADIFTFSVSDGTNELSNQDFAITITAVSNDMPVLTINNGVSLNQGASATISDADLMATDTETNNELLQFIVSENTINGKLVNTNNINDAISEFTQKDLNDGVIQYIHDDSNTDSDSFMFTVSDGTNELAKQIFNIAIVLNTGVNTTADIGNQIVLYPNPTSDRLYIKTDINIQSYELYTIDGRKVDIQIDNKNSVISVNHLNKGCYLIKLQSEKGWNVKSFIIN